MMTIRAEGALSAGYSAAFSEENRALYDGEDDERVRVLAVDPEDAGLAKLLELHHGKKVELVAVDPVDFAVRLGRLCSGENLAPAESGDDDRLALDRIANEGPVVNLVNSILLDAIRARASDIHIECMSNSATVRMRRDGVLGIAGEMGRERFKAVASRLKVMAGLNVMERRLPQDGRIAADLGGKRVDMRASFVPSASGESVVLRLFGSERGPRTAEELGMDAATLGAVDSLLARPHGLVLVTGPTGCGKSTTLAAMVRRLDAGAAKIVTIEDPVESEIDGVVQIQTNDAIGLTFDTLLRRVLRQDPNVIMVGEIRDAATAELAVRAALTGHLVLSSLHTNDSVSAAARLFDLGVEPYLVAGTLRGVLAQRLVRKVCPRCARWREAKPGEMALAHRHGVGLALVPEASGCEECLGSGYAGRIAVYEHFVTGEALEEAIARGSRGAELRELARNHGMRNLASEALELVSRGQTTLAEILREVEA